MKAIVIDGDRWRGHRRAQRSTPTQSERRPRRLGRSHSHCHRSLSSGRENLDGSWSLAPDQLGSLVFVPEEGRSGDIEITVTATAYEGETVEIPPQPRVATAVTERREQPLPEDKGLLDQLLARGDGFLEVGDLASARLFYELAAAEGSARAATGAGKTYDPTYYRQRGITGVIGNPHKAAEWYEIAVSGGAEEARERLRDLTAVVSGLQGATTEAGDQSSLEGESE